MRAKRRPSAAPCSEDSSRTKMAAEEQLRTSLARMSSEERSGILLYAKVHTEYVRAGQARASLTVGSLIAVVDEKDTGWYSGFALADEDHTPHWFPKSYCTEVKLKSNAAAEPQSEPPHAGAGRIGLKPAVALARCLNLGESGLPHTTPACDSGEETGSPALPA